MVHSFYWLTSDRQKVFRFLENKGGKKVISGRRENWIVICIIMLTLSSLSLFVHISQAEGEVCNRIIAIVNQDILTQKELQRESLWAEMPLSARSDSNSDPNSDHDTMGKRLIWAMIDERLQLQEARRMGISVYPEEIDQHLREIRLKNGLSTDQELIRVLESQHLTLESLRENIKKGILLMKLRERSVHSKVQVTDTEIADYFAAQKSKGKTEIIRLSHILFSLPEDADEETVARVRAEAERVREGVQRDKDMDFAEAARHYSQDSDTAKRGGDMGYLEVEQMSLPFQEEMARLQTGQISNPVRTSFGFHLLQITDRQANELLKGSERWKEIKTTLLSQKVQRQYDQWLEELRKQAYIEIK
ncbi:MAG: peptidylprolyl isomerase [bacterium]